MPPVTISTSGVTPTYAAASGKIPARQVAGQLSVVLDQMKKFIKVNNKRDQLFGNTVRARKMQGAGYGFPIQHMFIETGGHADGDGSPVLRGQSGRTPQFAFIDTKEYFADFQISKKFLKRSAASKGVAGQYVDSMDDYLEGMSLSVLRNRNWRLFGDGSGIQALVKTTPGSTTVATCHWWDTTNRAMKGSTYWLDEGLRVAFIRPATGAVVFTSTIIAKDVEAGTITLAADPTPAGVTAGDYIVRGVAASNDYISLAGNKVAYDGLYSPFITHSEFSATNYTAVPTTRGWNSGKYLEVFHQAPVAVTGQAVVSQWRPWVFGNANVARPYAAALMTEAFQRAKNEASSLVEFGSPNLILMSTDVYMEHFNDVLDRTQFQTFSGALGELLNDGEPLPTFSAMGKRLPIMTDELMVPGHIMMLTRSSWETVTDWEWELQPGTDGYLNNIPNSAMFWAWGSESTNMFCAAPRTNVLITDIQTSGRTLNG